MARIVDVLGRYRDGRLSCVEAAEVLGISERHFRRLRDKYEADGVEGLIDRRRGRASGRAVPVDRIEWMLEEYRTRYFDFNAKHFHERIKAEAKFEYGYTWTKTQLQKAGLVNKARRRSCHRKKRPRRPLPGMMLLQDGSPFRWIPSLDRDFDLIATMDDATSHVYSAFLVDEEGTMSTFTALCEVIAAKGLFSSLYTDRGSHYFQTPKAGGPVDKSKPTQVGRALSQLSIQHIPSYSPEARGRMERLFQTFQGRLPQELRAAGITDVETANRYIREVFLPAHNARFGVAPAEDGSAFVPVRRPRRDPVHPSRPPGRQGQLRARRRPQLADPAAGPPPSLRQGHRQRAPLPRRHARHLPRTAVPGALPTRRGAAHRSRRRSPPREPTDMNESARRPRLRICGRPIARPQPHRRHNHSRSGHLMRYQNPDIFMCH